MTVAQLFCDGDVVKVNPSPFGGTFAWIAIDELDRPAAKGSGLVTPADVGLTAVSNNLTELLAAVRALESVPDGWDGTLYTDSNVTFRRLKHGLKFKGIPPWLKRRALALRKTGRFRLILVKGHATKEQIENGWAGGRPTSKWNHYVDKECRRLARDFLAGKPIDGRINGQGAVGAAPALPLGKQG